MKEEISELDRKYIKDQANYRQGKLQANDLQRQVDKSTEKLKKEAATNLPEMPVRGKKHGRKNI